ncbi:MAG: Rpn family recombination-promoting nuclease/putative transposase, partial [Alloprevotella sp.]
MGKYINPFTDIGFKRIFGQEFSKPLLLDFLNNLLLGERVIVDLTFLDKEQPAEFEGDRSLIYDIYCKTDNGEPIIVEMQNRAQPFFKKRSIFYTAEAIARQGEHGVDWKFGIKAVYFVSFLNFTLSDISDKFRTDVALMDVESKTLFSTDIRMTYLQLPYFQKQPEDCCNNFERWIYVLKHMEALNRLPWLAKNPIFEKLAQISEISALTREERMQYDAAIRVYRDNLYAMEGAEEYGRREGYV